MTDEAPIEDQVQWRVDDGVAWITINAPEQGNALSGATP